MTATSPARHNPVEKTVIIKRSLAVGIAVYNKRDLSVLFTSPQPLAPMSLPAPPPGAAANDQRAPFYWCVTGIENH